MSTRLLWGQYCFKNARLFLLKPIKKLKNYINGKYLSSHKDIKSKPLKIEPHLIERLARQLTSPEKFLVRDKATLDLCSEVEEPDDVG